MLLFRVLAVMLIFLISIHADNLLKNPGFEKGIKNWVVKSDKTGDPYYSIDTQNAHSGGKALRWECTKNQSAYISVSQKVSVIPGRMYQFSAWVKTDKLRGSNGGATVGVVALDKNGKGIYGGSYPGGLKGSRGWWNIVSQTNHLQKNIFGPFQTSECNVLIYVRKNKKGFLGKAWWDDICFKPISMVCRVLRPSYKMTIADQNPELKLELEIWPEDFELKLSETQIVIKLDDVKSNKNVYNNKLTPKGKSFVFNDDMRALSNGNYKMTVVFMSKNTQKELWKEEFPIKRITSFKKYPIYIDQIGRTIVDGKPFFPLGIYSRNHPYYTGEKNLLFQLNNYLKNSPFNTVLSYDRFPKKIMNEFHKAGKKIIWSFCTHFNACAYHPSGFSSEEEEVPALIKVIKKEKSEPALLAWYINDEHGLGLLKNHLSHYFAINQTDLEHPSFNLHNIPDDMSELINACDIIGVDCYPIPRESISEVAKKIKETHLAVRGGRPVWAVLQMTNFGDYYGKKRMPEGRSPTEQEFRVMSWLAICNGANGIFYYSFHHMLKSQKGSEEKCKNDLEEYWPKYCRVANEISSFSYILLSEERKPDIKFTDTIVNFRAPHDLYWRSAISGNYIYIFVAKGDLGECSANLVINEKIKNLQVMTLGEDKSFKPINKFKPFVRDFFKKSTVKIYKGELVK